MAFGSEERNVNQNAAQDTVFSNLGLDPADLGAEDLGQEDLGGNQDDQGDDQDQGGQQQSQDPFDDPAERGRERREQREPRQRRQEGRDQFGRQRTIEPRPGERLRHDAKGNVVNADGRVVARAGAEARLYTKAHNATTQVQRLSQTSQDLTQRLHRAVELGQEINRRYEQVNAQQQQIRQLGITPEEQLEAMQMVALSKRNPEEAIKRILTRAAANGMDLTKLGLNAGGDPRALMDLVRNTINQEMTPLRQRQQQERQQQEQNNRQMQERRTATNAVRTFFNENPEARDPRYLPVFEATLKQFPNMTLGEIWARLQLHLSRREPQRQSRRALPRGRGMMPSADGEGGVAPVSSSYEDIMRGVLKDVGGLGRR